MFGGGRQLTFSGIVNKIAAFGCTLERHEHMACFWRELVDLSGSEVTIAELWQRPRGSGALLMISATNAK